MALLHIVIDVDVDPTLVDPHEVAMDILDVATIASEIEVFSGSLATVVSAEWA